MPFQPKENMIIAPICRRNDLIQMSNEDHEAFLKNLDESILNQVSYTIYRKRIFFGIFVIKALNQKRIKFEPLIIYIFRLILKV